MMGGKKLHVLVAGGGIGGMSAALALLKRGVDVDVYEQAGELREIGAGIQISPNGNRALDALGVFESLRALSCPTEGKEIRHWKSGKTWKLFDLGDASIRKYGFPYMTVYRPDLLQVLADGVRRIKPDAIHLGKRCARMEQGGDSVTLHFEDGGRAEGDALIGADGVHSVVRRELFGEDKPAFSGMIAWRTLLPMDRLPVHMARMVATNWIGPGGHVVHYPLQRGAVMNFVGTLEGATWDGPPWTEKATVAECTSAFAGWNEDVLAMISSAPSVLKWAMLGRDFLDHWTRGRATLLGDACHPTLPFLAQGAVMAIEDGVVLARCIEAYADTGVALQKYEQARLERTYKMVRGAADNTYRFHNPALADPDSAGAFIDREWRPEAIAARYDWLFTYDVNTAAI
jgi:salicylate hydroxylase